MASLDWNLWFKLCYLLLTQKQQVSRNPLNQLIDTLRKHGVYAQFVWFQIVAQVSLDLDSQSLHLYTQNV